MKWARMNNVSIAFFDLFRKFSMTDKIVVLSTCATEAEAETLARSMVEQRLAACVNVIPRIRSYYRWKGALESADECLLLIKSSRDRFPQLMAALEKAHSYEVPEVLALQVVDGAANYLNWLEASVADET
jgi:periplasmic divalent cation tolerance protein